MPTDESILLPGPHAKTRRVLRALLAVALAGGLSAGCGDTGQPTVGPTPDPAPSETTDTVSPTPAPSSDDVELPSGEVWQWAFGQNVWEDPLYTLSKEQAFSPGITDIYANTMGFSLTPDEQGIVRVVTLFNEGTGMVAYPGELPLGLDWSMTGGELVDLLGQESLNAVDGIPFSFSVVTSEGYGVDVDVAATHQEDLSDAPMTSITVRPPQ